MGLRHKKRIGRRVGFGRPVIDLLERRVLLSAADLDPTFGAGGSVVAPSGSLQNPGQAVVVQSDGKLLAVESGPANYRAFAAHSEFTVARYTAAGALDATFALRGTETIPVTANCFCDAIALQSDGKIVLGGVASASSTATTSQYVLIRLNADGSPDPTFGAGGIVTASLNCVLARSALGIQDDGKIVIAGNATSTQNVAQFGVLRFNTDGSPDAGFGTAGVVTTGIAGQEDDVWSVAFDAQKRIILAGDAYGTTATHSFLARYNADGTLDSTFASGGTMLSAQGFRDFVSSVKVTADGKIVTAGAVNSTSDSGSHLAISRYNGDGSPDVTYGTGGVATLAIQFDSVGAYAMAMAADGSISAVGTYYKDPSSNGALNFVLAARFNPAGVYDPAFGGTVPMDGIFYGVALLPTGSVVAVGDHNTTALLVRYTSAGGLDPSFGLAGVATTDFTFLPGVTAGLQPDGKLVVGNYGAGTTLVRFNSDGSPDKTFGAGGRVTPALGGPMAIQGDGKILKADEVLNGSSTWEVVRYNADGTVDRTFGSGGEAAIHLKLPYGYTGANVIDISVQPGGDIVIGGDIETYGPGGLHGFALARLTPSGTQDLTFGSGGTTSMTIAAGSIIGKALVLDAAGRIVVAGFMRTSPMDSFWIERYTAAGMADTSFGNGGAVTIASTTDSLDANAVAVTRDGKIVAAGSDSTATTSSLEIVRLNSNGTLDQGFGVGGAVTGGVDLGLNSVANSVQVAADNSVLVAGIGDGDTPFVARYTPAGVLDSTFGNAGVANVAFGDRTTIETMLLRPNGKIILAGTTLTPTRSGVLVAQFQGSPPPQPVALPGGPYTVAEGRSILLYGGGQVPAGQVPILEWDLNYDGITFHAVATGFSPVFEAGTLDGPSTRTVALRVRDALGDVSPIATAKVSITNAPPTAVFTGSTVTAGSAASVAFSKQTDPSPVDAAAGFRYSYDFNNDGIYEITDSLSATATVPAVYSAGVGAHTVRGRIKDKDGGVTVYTAAVQVNAATLGSISGTVFNDVNGDGIRETGDLGLAGWKVYLDTNNNGVPDAGEKFMLTGASGAYAFANMAAGSYRVRVVATAGYRRTLPSAASYLVTLASGQSATAKDFGQTHRVLLSGVVFNDKNLNGKVDAGEALSGWRMFLDSNNDGIWQTTEISTLTDGSGYYFFNLAPGTYRVREVLKSGLHVVTPSTNMYLLTLTAGAIVAGKNFVNH